MQRLTGVPSPKSDCTGWVGSGWAGIWKGWAGLNERRNEGLTAIRHQRSGTLLTETVELNLIFHYPKNFPDTIGKAFFNWGIKDKLGVQMGVRYQFLKHKI